MSDRRKSTRPDPEPSREPDLPALREIYAHQLRHRERKRLERLCGSVLQLTREAPMIVVRIESGGIDDQVRAAAVDLRHVERYLWVTGESEGDALELPERRLADVALRLAPRVAEIAAELESAAEEAAQ